MVQSPAQGILRHFHNSCHRAESMTEEVPCKHIQIQILCYHAANTKAEVVIAYSVLVNCKQQPWIRLETYGVTRQLMWHLLDRVHASVALSRHLHALWQDAMWCVSSALHMSTSEIFVLESYSYFYNLSYRLEWNYFIYRTDVFWIMFTDWFEGH
jgi:hypothetical protein